MNITLRHKATQKQQGLRKVMQLQLLTGAISKQIKDCFQPPSPLKVIKIMPIRNRKQEVQNTKHSMETTTSSFSTRHQSAQKHRKCTILNPQLQVVLKQHMNELNKNSNSYTIKWRNPVSNISKRMRAILGQWLMQLALELQMPKDTVYNAMHYTDKYVGLVNVTRSKYQSIGLCALFIASKLQLSNHPNINIFVDAMDGSITKSQLIDLQQNMVMKLKFRLNPPTLFQYMILLVSLFNNYIKRHNPGFVNLTPNSEIQNQLYWILDGIHLDNDYKCFHNKQKICLTVLYLSLKKERGPRTSAYRKKLFNELQTLKIQGETEKVFQSFLVNVIQIYKKLNEIKDCISYYRKWVKYQRLDDSQDKQVEQLKNIVIND